MTAATKTTLREMRAEVQRLGITVESAGKPIEELLQEAREADDPLGYLAIHAPSGDQAEHSQPSDPHGESPLAAGLAAAAEGQAAREEINRTFVIGGSTGDGQQPTPSTACEEESEPIGDVPAPLPANVRRSVSIEIPISGVTTDGMYISCHLDMRLSRRQAETLRRIEFALQENDAKQQNGRGINSQADAVRWLLDRLS
jgi:hypothetical protein